MVATGTEGIGLTVTVTAAVLLHVVSGSVPVTVYVTVVGVDVLEFTGFTVTVFPLSAPGFHCHV